MISKHWKKYYYHIRVTSKKEYLWYIYIDRAESAASATRRETFFGLLFLLI